MQKRSSRNISDTTFSVSSSVTSPPPSWRFDDNDDVDLPTYNPLSAAAKREQSRLRSVHNAIHLIPLLLLLCALVLWLFSNPAAALERKCMGGAGVLQKTQLIKGCPICGPMLWDPPVMLNTTGKP